MSLQKQVVPVSFEKGIDTKTSEFLTDSFLELQNCYQQKTGSIQKRPGLTSLSNQIIGSTSLITAGKSLFTYNNELLMHDGQELYAYSQPNSAWQAVNSLYTNKAQTNAIISNSYNQTIPARNVVKNIEVYAWNNANGPGVYWTAVEQSSGNIITNQVLLSAAYTNPKVLACGPYLFIFAIKSGTNLVSRRFDPLNPSVLSSETVIATNVNATLASYDVTTNGSRMVFAYSNSSANLVVGYLLQSNAVGGTPNNQPNPVTFTGITISRGLAIIADPSTFKSYVAYFNASTGLNHTALYQDLTVYLANTVIDYYVSTNIDQIGIVLATNLITFVYQISASANLNTFIKTNTLVPSTNTAGTSSVLIRSLGMLSKIFTISNQSYFAACYDSNTQGTNFVVRIDGFILSKFSYASGGGIKSIPNALCEVTSTNNLIEFAAERRVYQILSTGAFSFITGIFKHAFNFGQTSDIESEQLGQNLHIAGGIVQAYDGLGTTELGFLLNPEIPTFTYASGSLSGTYQYQIVWEWVDQSGQLHQSGPSPIATTSSLSSQNVTLTIPTLRTTFKQTKYNRTNVLAVIYRTLSNATTFFRVTSLSSPLYNDPTADTITYTDSIVDATLSQSSLIYTTGGLQPNFPVPSASILHPFQNRLFLSGTEYQNAVYYSKEFLDSEGVSFVSTFRFDINETNGGITALSDLDDKLIIFKQKSTYALSGPGPDDTGQNGAFSLPQIISGEIGCSEPRAIVRIPNGLMFLSDKGIYLLDRSLSFSYIGAPVEAFNSYTFSGSAIVADLNQARFTTLQGTTLVYDWFFNRWYTFTNNQSDSTKIWQNQFSILGTNGIVRVENQNVFSDDANPIITTIRTGWMSMAGIQGFQRIYSVLLLGKYVGNHVLTVQSFYNFKGLPFENVSITPANVIIGTIYGKNGVWGTNTVWGGTDNQDEVYQFEYKPAQQKCESFQLVIQDTYPLTTSASGGFELHAMSFVVGVNPGPQRLSAVRRLT